MQLEVEIIGAFIIGLMIGLQFFLRAQYRHLEDHVARLEGQLKIKLKPERGNGVPYKTRNGMEDVSARATNAIVRLQNLRNDVEQALWDVEVVNRLAGQIRNGEYDKDQAAASKHPPGDE